MPSKGRNACRHSRRSEAAPIRTAASAAALALISAAARAATVTSTWNTAAGTANWTNPARWTNSPAAATYPSNGRLGNVYDVVIGQGTPTLDTTVTVRSLTLSGAAGIASNTGTSSSGTNTINVTDAFTFGGASLAVNVSAATSAATVTLANPGTPKALSGTITVGGKLGFAAAAGTHAINAAYSGAVIDLLPTSSFALDHPVVLTTPPADPFEPRPPPRHVAQRGRHYAVCWGDV
jgi:hypothetical protein